VTTGLTVIDNTNEVKVVMLTFRAVDRSSIVPSAKSDMAYITHAALTNSPMFDPKETKLTRGLSTNDLNGTFTFGMSVLLKQPLKL
jgi:hypothetical protein